MAGAWEYDYVTETRSLVPASLNNCIVYDNSAPANANYSEALLDHCCTTPLPLDGDGNITIPPLFVDRPGGNLRLLIGSPCINAGSNAFVTNTIDLDGNPRIAEEIVDIGAYEFQPPLSLGAAVDLLIQLVTETGPATENRQSLLAILEAAKQSFARGNFHAAINQLSAFQNKVRAQVAPLDAGLAEVLIAVSDNLIELAGQPHPGFAQRERLRPPRHLAVRPSIGDR